jgi:hypothetical protein
MKFKINSIMIIGIVLYILVYEIKLFFVDGTLFQPLTNLYKLSFPFILLFYAGFNPKLIFREKTTLYYLLLYSILIVYLIVLNIFSSGFSFGFIEALRQIPRYFFLIGLVQFFLRDNSLREKTIKIVVMYSLFLTLMHFILLINPTIKHITLLGSPYAGPFGILGGVSASFYIPSLDFPIYRLTGWFNEPSNASAFLLASYFLGRSVQHKMPKSIFWKFGPTICLIGGLITFSNAGYVAIGFSFIVMTFLNRKYLKHDSSSFKNIIIIFVAMSVIMIGLFGRYYSAKVGIDSEIFSVITGNKTTYLNNPYYDASGGRINLMNLTIEAISNNPLGIGFINTAENVPAGAPLLWLLFSGIPGLIIILARESIIIFSVKKRYLNKELIYQYCALLTVICQQSIYGQWNNAFYYFLVSNILVKISVRK